jgi:hypothetical protein
VQLLVGGELKWQEGRHLPKLPLHPARYVDLDSVEENQWYIHTKLLCLLIASRAQVVPKLLCIPRTQVHLNKSKLC